LETVRHEERRAASEEDSLKTIIDRIKSIHPPVKVGLLFGLAIAALVAAMYIVKL
jgi:hypothetical protein